MIRMRHRTRREGTITVGNTLYQLDSNGCVDVAPEHASMMKQGSMWTEVELPRPKEKPAEQLATEEFPSFEDKPLQLDNLTREQLLQLAQDLGIPDVDRLSKLKLVAVIRSAQNGG